MEQAGTDLEKKQSRERVGSEFSDSSYGVVDMPKESVNQKKVRVDSEASSFDLVSTNKSVNSLSESEVEQTHSEPEGEPHHYDAETEGSETDHKPKIEPPSPSLSSQGEQHDVPLVDRSNGTRTPSLIDGEGGVKSLGSSPHSSAKRLSVEYDMLGDPEAKKRESIRSGSEQDEIRSTTSEESESKLYYEKKLCFEAFYKKLDNPDSEYVDKNGRVCNFLFSRLILSHEYIPNLQLQKVISIIEDIQDSVQFKILSSELLSETPEKRYDCLKNKLNENQELVNALDRIIQNEKTHKKILELQAEREMRHKKVRKLMLSDDEESTESYDFLADLSNHSSIKDDYVLSRRSQSVSEASDVDSDFSEKSEIKEYKEKLKECFSVFYKKLQNVNSETAAEYRIVCDFFFKICGLPNHHKRSQELKNILEQLTNENDRKILLDLSDDLHTKKTRTHRYEYLIQKLKDDKEGKIIHAIDRAIQDKRVKDLVQKAQSEEKEKWLKIAPMILESTPKPLEFDMQDGKFQEAISALQLELEREEEREAEQLNLQQGIVRGVRQKREEAPKTPTLEEELVKRNVELVANKEQLAHKLKLAAQENQRLALLVAQLQEEKEKQHLENLAIQQQNESLKEQSTVQDSVSVHIVIEPTSISSPNLNISPNTDLFVARLQTIEAASRVSTTEILPEHEITDKKVAEHMKRVWEATKEEATIAREAVIVRDDLTAQLRAFNAAGRTLGRRGGR